MKISSVCILGGSGFVGRAVADELAARGTRIRVVTRRRQGAMHLTVLPTAEVVVADIHDAAALRSAFENMDAVVNLVGILHEAGAQTFQSCHVELPRKVAEACKASGVLQLLHMSALGASDKGPSEYLRSKALGESALREAAGTLPCTVLRPAVIFGEGDRFLNLFATLSRWLAVIPLAGAQARFQPIWVEDVARCFASALGDPRTFGQAYDLGGPRTYTLGELVRYVVQTLGHRRAVVALPSSLANLQAMLLELLPGKLMTRDNLASMSVDNVCSTEFPAVFGFRPAPLEAIVPQYLAGTSSRARYSGYRYYAGR